MEYEQIWAPWRLSYIVGEKSAPKPACEAGDPTAGDPNCFLCQAAADGSASRQPDRQRFIVERNQYSLTMLNKYPYNNGHLLIAPRRHLSRLDELCECELLELNKTMARMIVLLEKVLKPEGFNVGLNLGKVAGAGLPGHLHWHIVPRWTGDTNFMPVFSGIRVIPQSLEALWDALSEALSATKDPDSTSKDS